MGVRAVAGLSMCCAVSQEISWTAGDTTNLQRCASVDPFRHVRVIPNGDRNDVGFSASGPHLNSICTGLELLVRNLDRSDLPSPRPFRWPSASRTVLCKITSTRLPSPDSVVWCRPHNPIQRRVSPLAIHDIHICAGDARRYRIFARHSPCLATQICLSRRLPLRTLLFSSLIVSRRYV